MLVGFDTRFSEQPGEVFVRGLVHDLGSIQSICVGADFVFGHKRSGNVALLKNLGDEIGFTVHGLAAVSLDGQIVSSTRIRENIRTGDLDAVSQMIGRPYAISGRVVEGARLGRQLGFPTANLDLAGLALPPNGVYSGLVNLNGQPYRTALNVGFRPTVDSGAQRIHVEAHILNFSGNIYGQELEIEIGDKLRDEKKFASPTELREQIARDIAAITSTP